MNKITYGHFISLKEGVKRFRNLQAFYLSSWSLISRATQRSFSKVDNWLVQPVHRIKLVTAYEISSRPSMEKCRRIYFIHNGKTDILKCREANLNDHDAIIGIGPMFHGLDRIPEMLHSYLEDPRRPCFVGEVDGRVVIFCMGYVVDGGHTLIAANARIHPDFRGRGIFTLFRNYSYATVTLMNPHATCWRALVRKWVVFKPGIEENTGSYNTLIQLRNHVNLLGGMMSADVQKSLVKWSFKTKTSSDDFKVSRTSDWRKIIENPKTQKILFSKDLIYLDWVPFRLMPANFDILEKECKIVFVSRSKVGEVKSMSMSYPHKVPVGLMLEIEYYGYNNPSLVLLHIKKQIQATLEISLTCPLYVSIFLECDTDITTLKSFLEDVGFSKSDMTSYQAACIQGPRERFLLSTL